MLFIRAIDLVLDQIDSHLRTKLGLIQRDSLQKIEDRLAAPLLSVQVDLKDTEAPEEKQSGPERNESDENIDTQAKLLKFGMTWSAFMSLPKNEFSKAMVNNCAAIPLEHNKLLIMFRLRNNMAAARNLLESQLKSREQIWQQAACTEVVKVESLDTVAHLENLDSSESPGKKNKKNKKNKNKTEHIEGVANIAETQKSSVFAKESDLNLHSELAAELQSMDLNVASLDAEFLIKMVTQIKEAVSLVAVARGLSETAITVNFVYKSGVGETEVLLEKSDLLLRDYFAFCEDVDAKTRRNPSETYALCDMLPEIATTNNPVIRCHATLAEYILKNIDSNSQHVADAKRNVSYFSGKYFTQQWYDPNLANQKRQQVAQFFIDLDKKLKDTKPEQIEAAVLSCVDIYFGHAHSIAPILSRSVQRIEHCYRALHEALLANASSDEVRKQHASECQAMSLLK